MAKNDKDADNLFVSHLYKRIQRSNRRLGLWDQVPLLGWQTLRGCHLRLAPPENFWQEFWQGEKRPV
jgi:hypothetical protein